VDLVLVDRAVELRIQDHRWRADVVLTRVVVVALVIGVVVVRGHRDWRRRARRPGTVMVTRTTCTARAAPGEDVGFAGSGRDQGQGRGRRGAVSRVHGHAVRRVIVLLILRREHCKRKTA